MTAIIQGHRVERHTSSQNLQKIKQETLSNINRYSTDRTSLDQRIRQLDQEWDIERYLETNASAIAFSGVILGAFVHRYWLILPAVVTGFLFQHALQGWCPPLPLFRKMGKRTRHEIEIERNALKALRQDYSQVNSGQDALRAAQRH